MDRRDHVSNCEQLRKDVIHTQVCTGRVVTESHGGKVCWKDGAEQY